MSYLLSHGADPNEPDEGLPLARAVPFEDPERLQLLLDAGADVNKKHNGRTALMEAYEHNTGRDLSMLLERGAKAVLADGGGSAAMDIAAYKGHDEIVKMLLNAMA